MAGLENVAQVTLDPGWPSGATPPIVKPVISRTQRPSARANAVPSAAAALSGSTRLAPEVTTRAGRSPARKIIDLAICATVQPTAAAASSAVTGAAREGRNRVLMPGGEQCLTHTRHRPVGIADRHTPRWPSISTRALYFTVFFVLGIAQLDRSGMIDMGHLFCLNHTSADQYRTDQTRAFQRWAEITRLTVSCPTVPRSHCVHHAGTHINLTMPVRG
jgi:hypothetical protein